MCNLSEQMKEEVGGVQEQEIVRGSTSTNHSLVPDDLCSQNSYNLLHVPLLSFQTITYTDTNRSI